MIRSLPLLIYVVMRLIEINRNLLNLKICGWENIYALFDFYILSGWSKDFLFL